MISDSLVVVSLTMSQYRKASTNLFLHELAADCVALPLDAHLNGSNKQNKIMKEKYYENVSISNKSI